MTHRTRAWATGMTVALVVGMSGRALAAPDKPPVAGPGLEPARVICGAQFRADAHGKVAPPQQCLDAAAAFYKEEWQPQVQALLAGDPKGMEALSAATTFQLPDGSIISGNNVPAYVATLFGANIAGIVAISDDFKFKPLDADTVMVYGLPKFTLKGQDGTLYTVTSAQLSVYRRTHKGTPPRGWEEVGELWTYQAPSKGPKPAAAVVAPVPAAPVVAPVPPAAKPAARPAR